MPGQAFRTCRFCRKVQTGLVHYARRSYAHGACLIANWTPQQVLALPVWALRPLPAAALDKAGLFERVAALVEADASSRDVEPMLVELKWGPSDEGFVESKCGRFRITPNYCGGTRPETYEVRDGDRQITTMALSVADAKDCAARYLARAELARANAALNGDYGPEDALCAPGSCNHKTCLTMHATAKRS